MAFIEFRNVSKIYKMGEVEIKALDDISFDIEKGEFVFMDKYNLQDNLKTLLKDVDAMVSELKLSARTEKKLKVKNADSLPAVKEVVVLN